MHRPSNLRLPLPLRLTAGWCALMVWWLGVLAASPDLHEEMHHHCEGGHHDDAAQDACVVTLFAQGTENPAAEPDGVIAPAVRVAELLRTSATEFVRSTEAGRQPPGRAPPRS